MSKRIAVVGAGLGGLCAAIKVREAGHDATIFEAADAVGGTWRANRYPGVACDVPAILYQFSFAPNPHWSHSYARGAEIHAYTKALVDQFGLADHLRLNEGVSRATWNDGWTVETTRGAVERFDAIVPALGQLSRPSLPLIAGIERFAGRSWHAAQWPDGADLTGKRVGVVGSAASAVQLIPEVAQVAAHLVVFQRTPNWCAPRNDMAVSDEMKALFATDIDTAVKLGALQREMIFANADAFFWQAFEWTPEGRAAFTRQALDHLLAQVADPTLRAELTPDYPIGCKRILFTDDFYPALTRSNVTLETSRIVEIVPEGVVTAGGRHHLDVLIFATGFETSDWNWSMDVVGEGGRRLADQWSDGPEAFYGILVAGFPDMFVLYGPNTNLGHNSITFMLERQVDFMVKALAADRPVAVSAETQRRFNEALAAKVEKTVWADPHCNSWYKDASGRIRQNWADRCSAYAEELAALDPAALVS